MKKIFVIISRENGVITATEDFSIVNKLVSGQIYKEEMAGGRPSVYYQEVEVV